MTRGVDEAPLRSSRVAVLHELRALVGADMLLRRIAVEMVLANERLDEIATISWYNRGGYDGPFLSGATFVLGAADMNTPREIFAGRGHPVALLLQFTGTGIATDIAFVCDDQGRMSAGFRASVTSDVELRILAAPHQALYVQPIFTAAVAALTLRVREGRL